ncbi:MAG: hypothetical protein H6710_12255 [Myxococcales bacterium]|nr:hypothetical protein [Myxococcales bacterium]
MPAAERRERRLDRPESHVREDMLARPSWRPRVTIAGLVAGAALALGLVACASKSMPSSLVAPAGEAAAAPADDAAFAADLEAEREEDADGAAVLDAAPGGAEEAELALADYERLLVEQELRLRAAGVPLAGDAEAQIAAKTPSGGEASTGAIGGTKRGDNAPRPEPPVATKPSTASRPTEKKVPKSKSTGSASGGYGGGAGKAAGDVAADGSGDACLTVCDLSAATCDLADRICGLADRHPGEERYSQVCGRAREDCRMASQACEACAA